MWKVYAESSPLSSLFINEAAVAVPLAPVPVLDDISDITASSPPPRATAPDDPLFDLLLLFAWMSRVLNLAATAAVEV
jgi:hypothetical protein